MTSNLNVSGALGCIPFLDDDEIYATSEPFATHPIQSSLATKLSMGENGFGFQSCQSPPIRRDSVNLLPRQFGSHAVGFTEDPFLLNQTFGNNFEVSHIQNDLLDQPMEVGGAPKFCFAVHVLLSNHIDPSKASNQLPSTYHIQQVAVVGPIWA
jgi:hypothetical protein